MTTTDLFPRETFGLAAVARPEVVRLHDGDRYELQISPVVKQIGKDTVRMLAYNGSIPGPAIHVDEGAEITVDVTNHGEVAATVHWHGLRLQNRFDGVPHETQAPIEIGETFTYKVDFPDPGFYWYHPHIREDVGQEMGLYGTIIVEPSDPSYWPPVDRAMTITLDDLLVEDGHIADFERAGPNYTAMGRFGNVMLINGEAALAATAAPGEVVRLYLVNTANTRIFNVALPGARIKLVGGDSGRMEWETLVDAVLLAPSERAVVDVLFADAGDVRLEHRTPDRVYDLGGFAVAGAAVDGARSSFDELRVDPALAAIRASLGHDLERAPDKVLAFVGLMPMMADDSTMISSSYACPMHPEVTSAEAGRCPECGMKLMPSSAAPMDMSPDSDGHASHDPHGGDEGALGDGLEWEDNMPGMNRASTRDTMIWQLIDRTTGAVNNDISWTFRVGDRVKIRLLNEMESDHPMHHPFHIHGAGRFLILARDGEPEPNLVWKDTVLVPAGQAVDILLDVSNPGLWMAHCHIAEHAESGMMFSFDVRR